MDRLNVGPKCCEFQGHPLLRAQRREAPSGLLHTLAPRWPLTEPSCCSRTPRRAELRSGRSISWMLFGNSTQLMEEVCGGQGKGQMCVSAPTPAKTFPEKLRASQGGSSQRFRVGERQEPPRPRLWEHPAPPLHTRPCPPPSMLRFPWAFPVSGSQTQQDPIS